MILKLRSGRRGYLALQWAFVLLPIVAGIDKLFHLLVNWNQYLSPLALRVLGSFAPAFMRLAGLLEICMGVGMIFRPSVFSYIISAWLLGIVVNLLLTGAYFDIALRDFVLVLATFALGNLSESFSRSGSHGACEESGPRRILNQR